MNQLKLGPSRTQLQPYKMNGIRLQPHRRDDPFRHWPGESMTRPAKKAPWSQQSTSEIKTRTRKLPNGKKRRHITATKEPTHPVATAHNKEILRDQKNPRRDVKPLTPGMTGSAPHVPNTIQAVSANVSTVQHKQHHVRFHQTPGNARNVPLVETHGQVTTIVPAAQY